jgi:polyhydroxyalkanoate synthase subunit PhaC
VRPWSRFFPTERRPRDWHETLRARTADGVDLALYRQRGRGGPPVLLLHGLSANRLTFDFPGRSLAAYLADHGFDAYVAELRGSGQSGRPSSWDLDDYVTLDLPAIVAAIREASGHDRLHWIGHSLGGILLFAYAAHHGDAHLASGVTIGSALDYTAGSTSFKGLRHLLPYVEGAGLLPWHALTHFLAPACGRFRNPYEAFQLNAANIEPEVVRTLFAHAFEAIPGALLASLASTFSDGGFASRDGSILYMERAAELRGRVCLVAGAADRQCSIETVEATSRLLHAAKVEVRRFGRDFGHRHDYGHFDLIIGRHAPQEVWPGIISWLRLTE